jgi:hypothetical protein
MLMPCCKTQKNKTNYKNTKMYQTLIDYIFNKLCIKEYIKKVNEMEKIKYSLLSTENLKKFELEPNNFPKSEKTKSIWEEEDLSFTMKPQKINQSLHL